MLTFVALETIRTSTSWNLTDGDFVDIACRAYNVDIFLQRCAIARSSTTYDNHTRNVRRTWVSAYFSYRCVLALPSFSRNVFGACLRNRRNRFSTSFFCFLRDESSSEADRASCGSECSSLWVRFRLEDEELVCGV